MNQVPELPARNRVDTGSRLIEKDDGRLVQDSTSERQPLFPSTRQSTGNHLLVFSQVGHLQRPINTLLHLLARDVVEPGKKPQVFNYPEIVVQREFLRHVTDVLPYRFRFPGHVESCY